MITQISIEKFRWNTALSQRFQLLLGGYLPDGSGQPFSLDDRRAHHIRVFQQPAETFWGGQQFSFEVPQQPTDDRFVAELRRRISDYYLPFLDRFDGVDETIAVLEEQNEKRGRNFFSAGLAVALAKLGRTEEAARQFKKSLGEPALVKQAAANYGILLDD